MLLKRKRNVVAILIVKFNRSYTSTSGRHTIEHFNTINAVRDGDKWLEMQFIVCSQPVPRRFSKHVAQTDSINSSSLAVLVPYYFPQTENISLPKSNNQPRQHYKSRNRQFWIKDTIPDVTGNYENLVYRLNNILVVISMWNLCLRRPIYGTRRFNAAITSALPKSLTWAESTHFLLLVPIYLRFILILPSHLLLCLLNGLFPVGLTNSMA